MLCLEVKKPYQNYFVTIKRVEKDFQNFGTGNSFYLTCTKQCELGLYLDNHIYYIKGGRSYDGIKIIAFIRMMLC